jgi:hypothetical protein
VQLPDIPADATLDLQDVDFSSCNDAQPAKIAETFSGVIRNVPSSSNGNLNVCVNSGGEHRVRVVKLQDATFKDANGDDASFEDLEEGQFIEAVGEREGQGLPSALDADTVQILGAGNASTCSGIPTETPTQTPTVTTTPEPTATPTPTPT